MKSSLIKYICLSAAMMLVGMNARAVEIKKDLAYHLYTLTDNYFYGNTVRVFQWDKMEEMLARIERLQREGQRWGVLQNYKHFIGVADVAHDSQDNRYGGLTDIYGVERYQSVPMYLPVNPSEPQRYGRDGSLVKVINENVNGKRAKVAALVFDGVWSVPLGYLKNLEVEEFKKAIFIDRTNQNITTMEKVDSVWYIRSMNPATTGLLRPPYMRDTPVGVFVVQSKSRKMWFYKDGTTEIGGYAPYASRFTNGAYVHGIPVNLPAEEEIEYSSSLGTTPRSHMCVRNASSHAKFVYDWGVALETLVFVFD